ncbi:MAG TPA: hypothetical protein VGB55_03565 [Tepidisphaeraceae bacterium]|jgi:energy-converting hydrogenase Eha subunit E
MKREPEQKLAAVAWAHGFFWVLSGIWPLMHMGSFLAVSGPKHDLWLVKTVGLLLAVIGVVLVMAGRNKRVTPEIIVLAIGAAAALIGIDVYYALRGVIWKIYLLDAAVEAAIIAAWIWAMRR